MTLHLEARFGPSTLHNYAGILRNQLFTTARLSNYWRAALAVVLGLPLGLSVAYKTFIGGESSKVVNVKSYTGNFSEYGMFAPPGLQLLGEKTGVSLFSNATLPFAVATSLQEIDSEPALSKRAQAFGFNILLLNNEGAAVLDIPHPRYITAVQELLTNEESWNNSATVLATVATSTTQDQRMTISHHISRHYVKMPIKAQAPIHT